MKQTLKQTIRIIASKKHKYLDNYIFIHINKTGGSSVEKALGIPFEHKTSIEKIREIGQKNWDKKLTFTVIRNPWDKVVSHYHYRVKTNQTGLSDNPIGFKKWVKLAYWDQDTFYYDNPKMFMPQINWIADEKGMILVDELVHFENLESEFKRVMAMLGKNVILPHVKKSNRGNYRKYYDRDTIEIINIRFKQDIERFGYQF